MGRKPMKSAEIIPLEMWADGIEEHVYMEEGQYYMKPGAPGWVKDMLDEYNAMLDPAPGENGKVTLY